MEGVPGLPGAPQDDAGLTRKFENPEETKIEKDTCTPMFIAALFTIARTWKQPRCPSADEWIRKHGRPHAHFINEETSIEKDPCISMFIAALFTIARTWKQPRCPSTGMPS